MVRKDHRSLNKLGEAQNPPLIVIPGILAKRRESACLPNQNTKHESSYLEDIIISRVEGS